jgi:long-chain acyl-CoA synthetase
MPEFARAAAEANPEAIALRDDTAALGWAEVGALLDQVAWRIIEADLGTSRRVAVFAENSAQTALAHLGGLLGGASTVPVNFHLNASEAAYILGDSDSRILFVGPETADRGLAAAHEAGVELVVGWGEDLPDGVLKWSAWLGEPARSSPPIDIEPRPNLLYTSGTTGRPKGTELPPTMFAGGVTMEDHFAGLRKSAFARLGTHLVVGPMYHTGPLGAMRLLVAGVPSVILSRFDPEATLQAIETYSCEAAVMVPTHFVRLLALPEEVKNRYDISSMKLVAHTGASCPVDVKRSMIEWWGPVFVDAYGASEVGTTCQITSEDWLEHPGSVGRAIPPFEALVVDDDNNEVAAGVEGRLFFRDTTGRGVIYPSDPEKTAEAHIAPGVFTLGEIGYIDEDGFVFITDRFSDMVVSGGVNIYPAESEQILLDHPAIADAACIGVPHAEMGEQLHALVVPEDPASPLSSQEIIDYCRDRLSHYKCPRSAEIVDDVGRNTMGKLNKRALRDQFASDHGALQ